MASKLLSAAALFVTSSAIAAPPVDTRRVTGNVSTEHQPKPSTPPIDTCRVTGNITPGASKSGTRCVLSPEVNLALHLTKLEEQQCSIEGTPATVDATPACRIDLPNGQTYFVTLSIEVES
jgi:hypothetical protein